MSKDRIPYIEENTIDVAAAVNDSLRVVDGVVTDRVEAIVDELPQDAKQSDKYAVNAGDKAGLIAKFVETDAGGFWEYFDSILCEYEGIVYVSDGKSWNEVKSTGCGIDLSKYRKIDDNKFVGVLQISCQDDNIGNGIYFFKQDEESFRANIVVTDSGMQFNHSDGSKVSSLILPHVDTYDFLATRGEIEELKNRIAALEAKLLGA